MDKEDRKNLLVIAGLPVALALVVLVTLPIGLFNAWVTQKLYIWFLLPLGLPALNLLHVYGITLLINSFRSTSTLVDKKSVQEKITTMAGSIIASLVILVVAWIVKGWI